MDRYTQILTELKAPAFMEKLAHLYGRRAGEINRQLARYVRLVQAHQDLFHCQNNPLYLVSAPGRTEIIGNHTDHNNGRVLAAAVNLDCLSCVSPRNDLQVNIHSQGYPVLALSLDDLTVHPEEAGTSAALVRGVARGMKDHGFFIGGFDAVVTSDVLGGSGLSSSAAYEVMICAVLDALYNGFSMHSTLRAQIAQYAENAYFGKPSGLMDQMACSTGGLVTIDFRDENPGVRPLSFNFEEKGFALVVVNTGGSHDNLTPEYAAIRTEMEAVAAFFGQKVLRTVAPKEMYRRIGELRKTAGERAILRAIHYFNENDRVERMVRAIEADDLPAMLQELNASGESSWKLLQNVYCVGTDQPMTLALALAEKMLCGCGAWRVHGGGFAGTTLNFVPDEQVNDFVAQMEAAYGTGACFVLDVRPEGAAVMYSSPSA